MQTIIKTGTQITKQTKLLVSSVNLLSTLKQQHGEK